MQKHLSIKLGLLTTLYCSVLTAHNQNMKMENFDFQKTLPKDIDNFDDKQFDQWLDKQIANFDQLSNFDSMKPVQQIPKKQHPIPNSQKKKSNQSNQPKKQRNKKNHLQNGFNLELDLDKKQDQFQKQLMKDLSQEQKIMEQVIDNILINDANPIETGINNFPTKQILDISHPFPQKDFTFAFPAVKNKPQDKSNLNNKIINTETAKETQKQQDKTVTGQKNLKQIQTKNQNSEQKQNLTKGTTPINQKPEQKQQEDNLKDDKGPTAQKQKQTSKAIQQNPKQEQNQNNEQKSTLVNNQVKKIQNEQLVSNKNNEKGSQTKKNQIFENIFKFQPLMIITSVTIGMLLFFFLICCKICRKTPQSSFIPQTKHYDPNEDGMQEVPMSSQRNKIVPVRIKTGSSDRDEQGQQTQVFG